MILTNERKNIYSKRRKENGNGKEELKKRSEGVLATEELDEDGLPLSITLDKALENLPRLAPVLIEGILRQGHKMLISGSSKAGKSFY